MDRKVCLDSDILIEITRNNLEVIGEIKKIEGNLYSTPINIFEVWSGRISKEESNTRTLIESLKIADFDKNSSIRAGDIQLKLKEIGNLIDFRDLFIASICIVNNLELLTNNKKHFERLKKFGLKLIE